MSEAGAAGAGATAAAAAAAAAAAGGGSGGGNSSGGAGALQQGSPAAGGLAACGPARAVISAAATAESPAAAGGGGGGAGGGGPGSARIAGKKAQLRSAPRAKKLEKLGVYSACKVPARPGGGGGREKEENTHNGRHRSDVRPQASPASLLPLRGALGAAQSLVPSEGRRGSDRLSCAGLVLNAQQMGDS